jgi:hypothetical protein
MAGATWSSAEVVMMEGAEGSAWFVTETGAGDWQEWEKELRMWLR